MNIELSFLVLLMNLVFGMLCKKVRGVVNYWFQIIENNINAFFDEFAIFKFKTNAETAMRNRVQPRIMKLLI